MSKSNQSDENSNQRSPHEQAKERLIELILAIRRDLLKQGANPITHWSLLESRLKIASRTTTEAEAFYSQLLRLLAIPSASSSICSAYNRMAKALKDSGVEEEFLAALYQRVPAIIAEARVQAEAKRAESAALRKETEEFYDAHGMVEP